MILPSTSITLAWQFRKVFSIQVLCQSGCRNVSPPLKQRTYWQGCSLSFSFMNCNLMLCSWRAELKDLAAIWADIEVQFFVRAVGGALGERLCWDTKCACDAKRKVPLAGWSRAGLPVSKIQLKKSKYPELEKVWWNPGTIPAWFGVLPIPAQDATLWYCAYGN